MNKIKKNKSKKLRNYLILIGIFITLLIFSLVINNTPEEKEIKVKQIEQTNNQDSNITTGAEQLVLSMTPLIFVAIAVLIGTQIILPFFRNQGVI
jgi:uncharacterized protein YpmS